MPKIRKSRDYLIKLLLENNKLKKDELNKTKLESFFIKTKSVFNASKCFCKNQNELSKPADNVHKFQNVKLLTDYKHVTK